MSPSDPELTMRAPWQVCLVSVAGETHYKVHSHVAPSVVLDRGYWSGGDAGPTDAFNFLVHDEHADVADSRVGLGWVIAAAPAMRAALRDLLAARSSDELADAMEKARDALALAALPVGNPEPPAGYHFEAASLAPKADSGIDPKTTPDSNAVAELVAHMAEFGPRKFTLSVLAQQTRGTGRQDCEWDANAGDWTAWKPTP